MADSSTIMLGALAGGMGARVLDDAAPTLSYTFALGGRTFTVRASAAAALIALGAVLMGVKLPGESLLLPMAAGALAYEATAEVGDDVTALILGLPMPGAPTPLPAGAVPPVLTGYQYPGGYVDDYALSQALGGMR